MHPIDPKTGFVGIPKSLELHRCAKVGNRLKAAVTKHGADQLF